MAGGVIRSAEIASNLNAKEELVSRAMEKIDAARWDVVIYEIATRKIESIPAKNVKEFGKHNSVESSFDLWLPRLSVKFDAVAIPTGTLSKGDILSPSQVDVHPPPDLSNPDKSPVPSPPVVEMFAGQLRRELEKLGDNGRIAIMVDSRAYILCKTILAERDNGILLFVEAAFKPKV